MVSIRLYPDYLENISFRVGPFFHRESLKMPAKAVQLEKRHQCVSQFVFSQDKNHNAPKLSESSELIARKLSDHCTVHR